MTLYREEPCKHGQVGDCDAQTHGAGRYCPGGSREEVTIDYKAAKATAFRLRHRFMAGQFAEVTNSIVDAALGEEEQ